MAQNKGIFIGILGLLIASFSFAVEYYFHVYIASMGIATAFIIGVIGFFVHLSGMSKK